MRGNHGFDFYMHRLVELSSVTGLGTGRERHSQAKHAQELRKDVGWDSKPEYTGGRR